MRGLLSFTEALEGADEVGAGRHLLLGNGFSIACRPDCFNYGRLLDEADLRDEYASARAFLANFKKFFTVNYDLLLYWTLLQEMEPKIKNDDGFRQDRDEPEAEWVSWDSYRDYSRNVYYLHGGLHLFEEAPLLKKLTFSRTGVPLIAQIREALDREAYPLLVTEGTSAEKHARVRHNDYLSKGLRSLASCKDSLLIHGHSLADNDEHVYRAIVDGKFAALFVSLHGDPDDDDNRAIRRNADAIAAQRPEDHALAVRFYDSD